MKIKRVADLMSDYVEVDEASRPKLTYDENKEQEAEQNPLLEKFYVYLQILLSQALEPGFLVSVYEKKEDTYMVPMAEIDKLVKQKIDQMERVLRWNPAVKVNTHIECRYQIERKLCWNMAIVSTAVEPGHTKKSYAICEQQRRRSACASAQSDQHLCCLLLR